MIRRFSALCLGTVLLAAGCSGSSVTAPSSNANSLLGTWASVSSAPSTSGNCANFQWAITDVSGLTGSGSFSATCFGSLQISGTGSGTLSGMSIAWSVAGTASGSGQASCAVSASGSAKLTADGSIEIPYSGSTCLGPVSGTQVIRKR